LHEVNMRPCELKVCKADDLQLDAPSI